MRNNLLRARARAPHSKVWAVVKANAYGHGLEPAAEAFADADGLALIEFDAAQRLRDRGWKRPLLMLEGAFDMADVHQAAELGLTLVVHCEEQVRMFEGCRLSHPLPLQLKVNTGMNRLGFRPAAVPAMAARLRASGNALSLSFITHLANADLDQQTCALPAARQLAEFTGAVAGLDAETSIANSAADLMLHPVPGNWIRPGIMLYGGSPGAGTGEQYGLQSAMTLRSRIIGVQQVQAGESVGYGSRFTAQQNMRIGVVACGYADGYPRHAPDGTPVLVDGVRTGVAGRVSMDMITVDLTPVPQAAVGSEVLLWGPGLSVDEVAQSAGTIGYELLCALAPRVKREHLR